MRSSSALTMAGLVAIVAGHTSAAYASEVGLSFELDPVQPKTATDPKQSSVIKVWSPLDQTAPRSPRQTPKATKLPTTLIPTPNLSPSQEIATVPDQWWQQGSDSPLAIAIGAAEGTRMTDGGKTSAYYWHSDPGNGADNFGTFSYQHLQPQEKQGVTQEAKSSEKRAIAAAEKLPEMADELQLKKLKVFHDDLRQQARAKGMTLSELELINGLDLANQSEAAALSELGYIDRLAQMRELVPNDPEEQILEARTWSYWSPEKHAWDAPGLGNTYETIRQDQARRMGAVQEALQQSPHHLTAPQPPSIAPQKALQEPVAPSPNAFRSSEDNTTLEGLGFGLEDFESVERQAFQQQDQHLAQSPGAENEQEAKSHPVLRPNDSSQTVRPLQPQLPQQPPLDIRQSNDRYQAQQTAQPQTEALAVDAIIFYEFDEHFI